MWIISSVIFDSLAHLKARFPATWASYENRINEEVSCTYKVTSKPKGKRKKRKYQCSWSSLQMCGSGRSSVVCVCATSLWTVTLAPGHSLRPLNAVLSHFLESFSWSCFVWPKGLSLTEVHYCSGMIKLFTSMIILDELCRSIDVACGWNIHFQRNLRISFYEEHCREK